jgi:hypothetical protein
MDTKMDTELEFEGKKLPNSQQVLAELGKTSTETDLEMWEENIPDTPTKKGKKRRANSSPEKTSVKISSNLLICQAYNLLQTAHKNEENIGAKELLSSTIELLNKVINPTSKAANTPEKGPEKQQIDIQMQLQSMQNQLNQISQTIDGTLGKNQQKTQPIGRKLTYADYVKQPNQPTTPTQQNKYIEVRDKKPRDTEKQSEIGLKSQKSQKKAFEREKRLIIVTPIEAKEDAFKPKEIRDNINAEFALNKDLSSSPIVAAVTKSQFSQNIILTTTDEFDAKFLIKHQNVWKKLIPMTHMHADKDWHKAIIHGIQTEVFLEPGGMESLKFEIETFNKGITLDILPRWLSKRENLETKKHGSVVIAVESKELLGQILGQRLKIAGELLRTQKFLEFKSSEQCSNCQGYGHKQYFCKKDAKCRICAKDHATRIHECIICNIKGKECIHTDAKCTNCKKRHTANSKTCEFQ